MAQALSNVFAMRVTASGSVPAWVPQPGQWANVPATNNAQDVPIVFPTGSQYPAPGVNGTASSMGDAWLYWARRIFVPSFGTLGGYILFGSGHTSLFQPMMLFDLGTLTWTARHIPDKRYFLTDARNSFGEYADGSADAEHTYGLGSYAPTAWYGVPCAIIETRFQSTLTAIHKVDLTATGVGNHGVSRVNDPLTSGMGVGEYGAGMSVDLVREGWWLNRGDNESRTMFMHRTGTWQIHNTGFYFASKFVAYYPPSDMLIAWTAEATQRLQGWKCDGSNGGAKYLTLTGTPPTQTGAAKWPAQLGFTWSPLKNAFVSYGGGIVASSYGAERVFYLTPPAVGQEFTGTWTWSSEDFTSGDGSTPPTEGYGNEGATAMWEIPQWSRPGQVTLLECGSWRRAPQVRVTLAG